MFLWFSAKYWPTVGKAATIEAQLSKGRQGIVLIFNTEI
jgi:hypothetical protein